MLNIILAQATQLGTGTGVGSTPEAFGNVIGTLINLVFVVGGASVLYFVVMGAIQWISSEGEKEKLAKAQKTITNAVIGFIVLVLVWSLFFLLTTDIFDIFNKTKGGGGFELKLPSLFQ